MSFSQKAARERLQSSSPPDFTRFLFWFTSRMPFPVSATASPPDTPIESQSRLTRRRSFFPERPLFLPVTPSVRNLFPSGQTKEGQSHFFALIPSFLFFSSLAAHKGQCE